MSLDESIKVSSFHKKFTTQNTDKAVDVIVRLDPTLSECSDVDSDSDANEESNKQLPGKSKTSTIYESTESEYSESDNTDDESSMNNDNDKSVLRVENKKRKTPKQNRTFAGVKNYYIMWIQNTEEIILTTLQMNYGHQNNILIIFLTNHSTNTLLNKLIFIQYKYQLVL